MGTTSSTPSPLERAHHDLSALPLYSPSNAPHLNRILQTVQTQRRLLETIEPRLEDETHVAKKREKLEWERECMRRNGTLQAHEARLREDWEREQLRLEERERVCWEATRRRGEREREVREERRREVEVFRAGARAEAEAAGFMGSVWGMWESVVGVVGALFSRGSELRVQLDEGDKND